MRGGKRGRLSRKKEGIRKEKKMIKELKNLNYLRTLAGKEISLTTSRAVWSLCTVASVGPKNLLVAWIKADDRGVQRIKIQDVRIDDIIEWRTLR